jgi:LacI family transcriptional regulator
MKHAITIKELAKIVGYAPSTISKALNNSHEISTVTKNKIKKAAQLYSYKPNYFASALRRNKRK